MRTDAARNQQLILRAAQDVFSEHGPDAAMELISAHAGVGVGTIYRRYPNKEALIAALVVAILDDLCDAAQDALDAGDRAGLRDFLHVLGTSFSDHRGYAAMLMEHTTTHSSDRLRTLIDELTQQAKRTGTLASWVELDDVMSLIWAVRGIIQSSDSTDPGAWQRHLDISLAGLHMATFDPAAMSSSWSGS